MARGAITSEGSGGENIHHFSTIRVRATGLAELRIKVISLDADIFKILVPLTLEPETRIQPNRLVNFIQQRASFEFTTTGTGEYFRMNRIIIYMKEIYTSYPGA